MPDGSARCRSGSGGPSPTADVPRSNAASCPDARRNHRWSSRGPANAPGSGGRAPCGSRRRHRTSARRRRRVRRSPVRRAAPRPSRRTRRSRTTTTAARPSHRTLASMARSPGIPARRSVRSRHDRCAGRAPIRGATRRASPHRRRCSRQDGPGPTSACRPRRTAAGHATRRALRHRPRVGSRAARRPQRGRGDQLGEAVPSRS